jgi:hypothetical protein
MWWLDEGFALWKADSMTRAAQKVLNTFDALPEEDRKDLTVEILRRTAESDYFAPEDEELLLAADRAFLERDRCDDAT